MLVLSRRVGARVIIGHNITVTIVAIAGGQCRIGIDAPKDIPVHREEIETRIARENAMALARQPRPQA